MSTLVRRLTLYKAQGGARVSDLEQLQASISLPSTIKMVFSLRKFSKISIILVLAWSFYYIGSQASQREYVYAISDPLRNLPAVFPSDHGPSDFDDGIVLPSVLRSYAIDFHVDYYENTGSNPVSTPGIDFYGYPLIPDKSAWLEPFGTVKPGDWMDVSSLDEAFYVTWAGFPITIEDPPGSGIWSQSRLLGHYSVNTSYFQVRCESVEMVPWDSYPRNATRNVSFNMTTRSNTSLAPEARKFEVWTKWNASVWSDSVLNLPTINGSTLAVSRMLCNITRPQVEIFVRCSEIGCLTKKLRFLPLNDTALYQTPFDDDRWAETFFHNLLTMDPSPDQTDPAPRVTWVNTTSVLERP